ncbi:Hypothetical protein FKW44_004523, partial [Caligus rogercresseyi]
MSKEVSHGQAQDGDRGASETGGRNADHRVECYSLRHRGPTDGLKKVMDQLAEMKVQIAALTERDQR